jgi:hypothetical protein
MPIPVQSTPAARERELHKKVDDMIEAVGLCRGFEDRPLLAPWKTEFFKTVEPSNRKGFYADGLYKDGTNRLEEYRKLLKRVLDVSSNPKGVLFVRQLPFALLPLID